MDTVVTSLESSFSPREVASLDSMVTCTKAFQFVALLASEGYLSTAKPTTISSLVSLLSSFVNSDVFVTLSNMTEFQNLATSLSDQINEGVLLTTVPG
jgi:hypothetical protein